MAALGNPTLVISAPVASDCKSFAFSDDTGAYNVSTNPHGYGGGVNIPSSAVQNFYIRVYQYGQTTPYLFTFSVNTNTITAATLTAPNGTVTNIFSSLTSTVFPFSSATSNAFSILNTWIGFSSSQKLSDQVWTISYEIVGVYTNLGIDYDFDLITSVDLLVDCNTCCCIKKMAANLKTNCCDCGNALMTYLKAKAMLDSANASADIGEYDAAQKAIEKASELCDQNCSGC